MRQIIGIFGQQQHGKTTLAKRLCKDLNRQLDSILGFMPNVQCWTVESTIEKAKTIMRLVYGLTPEELESWKLKDERPPGWNMTMRQALRHLTTECFEAICPSTWMDCLFKGKGNQIFDNGRKITEAVQTKEAGGVTILIYRPEMKNYHQHETELQMRLMYDVCFTREGEQIDRHDAFDFYFPNTKDLDFLNSWCQSAVPSILNLLRTRRLANEYWPDGTHPDPMGSVAITESSP